MTKMQPVLNRGFKAILSVLSHNNGLQLPIYTVSLNTIAPKFWKSIKHTIGIDTNIEVVDETTMAEIEVSIFIPSLWN